MCRWAPPGTGRLGPCGRSQHWPMEAMATSLDFADIQCSVPRVVPTSLNIITYITHTTVLPATAPLLNISGPSTLFPPNCKLANASGYQSPNSERLLQTEAGSLRCAVAGSLSPTYPSFTHKPLDSAPPSLTCCCCCRASLTSLCLGQRLLLIGAVLLVQWIVCRGPARCFSGLLGPFKIQV